MKQIDAYVDSVYPKIGGNRQEIQELKIEMKGHLLEAVYELKAAGMTEQEAIDIAIERFGEEQEMRSIIGKEFQTQKTFAKWILIIAIASLIICGTLLACAIIKEIKMGEVQNSTFNQLAKMVEGKENLTPRLHTEIKSLVKNKNGIKSVHITNSSGKEVFYYEKVVLAPKWLYSYHNNGIISDKLSFTIEVQRFNDIVLYGLFSGIAMYWTLFTVWAIVNAYHHKRLNIGWIIIFAFLNVLGYLIYHISGNRTANLKGA